MNNSNVKKLAIGTVQFGMDYGISNKKGKSSFDEVREILHFALDQDIKILDTAYSYGDSESILGKFNLEKFNIISKFPLSKDKSVSEHLKESLQNLNCDGLYGYMAHSANVLIEAPGKWDELIILKEKGTIRKIGYSVYKPSELEKLLSLGLIADVIQLPYNIIDRRFEKYFEELKDLHVEIHTRSTFLQGLFFMDPEELSRFFEPLKRYFNYFKGLPSSEIAGSLLLFCVENPFISKVVIGINNKEQLQQNINAMLTAKQINFAVPDNIPEEVLLPFNWPKL